ncbi:hypothetical protein EP7_003868 [Isosphaeraceae bacterium EP7]
MGVNEIDLEVLQLALVRLLEHMRFTRGLKTIPLESDYYWSIPRSQSFDLTTTIEASDIDVGSLFDELEIVRKLATRQAEPLSIELAMISGLLRYVGNTVGELTSKDGG